MNRYTTFSDFLGKYFTGKVQKLSVDAGFSCPNRDGTIGRGGCHYCNNQTFSPGYCAEAGSVERQLEEGKNFFRKKYPEMKYLAYFQSYTGTYAAQEDLKRLYEEALSVADVEGIVIGTRPDCMPGSLLDYLSQLAGRYFVMIEYGVECTDDDVLRSINRGHSYACAADAVRRTAERGIPVGVHLIMGLPGHRRENMVAEAGEISALPVDVVKLHQLQIVRGTAFSCQYKRHPEAFRLFEPEDYVRLVVDFVERLRPGIAVERFTSQSPKELLIAPDWGLKNYEFTALVHREMERRNSWQGCRYVSPFSTRGAEE